MSVRFGTDGIRGRVGRPPLTPACLHRLGRAIAEALAPEGVVLIGRDTRPSGPMITKALASGLLEAGCAVEDIGVAPSPAVAFLVGARHAALGIVVTASHNPAADNGIKLFATDGAKIPREHQQAIERAYERLAEVETPPCAHEFAPPRPGALAPYIERVVQAAGGDGALAGLHAVIDCARGAASAAAPAIFERLGVRTAWIGAEADGARINDGVGALFPERAAERVRALGADIGLSFDGDADRLIVSDERGVVHDGDALLYALARLLRAREQLAGDVVVATIMSNRGLEDALAEIGVRLERTPVGDQHISERLRSGP